jgi:hypothetical protein
MYVGMGMSFVGRRNEKGNGEGESEKAEHGTVAWDVRGNGNELCREEEWERNGEGGIRKGRTWNGENGLCWEGESERQNRE